MVVQCCHLDLLGNRALPHDECDTMATLADDGKPVSVVRPLAIAHSSVDEVLHCNGTFRSVR